MAQSRPNRRGLLLEGVVVFVSVLLAFFLEGWRDDRGLRQDLLHELQSVERELEVNRRLAAAEVGALERINAAGAEVLDQLRAAGSQPFTMVDDTLVTLAVNWSISFGPSLGAVEALISSGRLAQVEDPGLRSGLAGLRERIADVVEDELAANELVASRLTPRLVEHMSMDHASFGLAGTAFFADAYAQGISPQEHLGRANMVTFGAVEFPNDRVIRNYLALRMTILRAGQAEFGSLVGHLDELLALVAEELR